MTSINYLTNDAGHKYIRVENKAQLEAFQKANGLTNTGILSRLDIQDGKVSVGDIIFVDTKEVRDLREQQKALEEKNEELNNKNIELEKENEEPVVSEGNVVGALTGAGAGALITGLCVSNPAGWVVGAAAAVCAGVGWLLGELF